MCNWEKVCTPKGVGGLGFRQAQILNLSYMSKLGWNLVHNHDELWVKVLWSRYGCGSDLLPKVELRNGCSNIWKGIVRAWEGVENNLMWRVGDGLSVRFWVDNWIPHFQPLRDLALIPLCDADLQMKVA